MMMEKRYSVFKQSDRRIHCIVSDITYADAIQIQKKDAAIIDSVFSPIYQIVEMERASDIKPFKNYYNMVRRCL